MTDLIQNISGGHHNHFYQPQKQQEFVNKEPVTARLFPKDIQKIDKAAEEHGLTRSTFIAKAVMEYIDLKPKLGNIYQTLDTIFR